MLRFICEEIITTEKDMLIKTKHKTFTDVKKLEEFLRDDESYLYDHKCGRRNLIGCELIEEE